MSTELARVALPIISVIIMMILILLEYEIWKVPEQNHISESS